MSSGLFRGGFFEVDQVTVRKDVLGIHRHLDSAERLDTQRRNLSVHKLLTVLTDTMVMADRTTMLHNLITGGVLNVVKLVDGIRQSLEAEAEIEVYTSSDIINLY